MVVGLGVRLISFSLLVALAATACASLGGNAGCPDGTPTFVYGAPNKLLRQSDVATLTDGEQTYLTNDHLSSFPAFSSDGRRVVFSTGRDGEFHADLGFERLALFTGSPTGGDEERLTKGPFDTEPEWSPDGSKVVFVRGRGPGQRGGGHELWTVDVETKRERRLMHIGGHPEEADVLWSPAWSPDGKRIAFARGTLGDGRAIYGGQDLWVMDSDGSNPRKVLSDMGSALDPAGLDWSPDGDALAFDGSVDGAEGLHVMDLDDRRTRLLDKGAFYPAWSPDGSRIAYFDYLGDARLRLSLVDADGGHKDRVEGAPELTEVYGGLDWAACG
jgi:TolB protein